MSKPIRRNTTHSNTYRFFVDPTVISGDAVILDDADIVHQVGAVLRLRAGEQVVLLDGAGSQYVVTLTSVERRRVTGEVARKEDAPAEPRTHLTLALALIRAERFEWALQKGTEIGVSAFLPLITQRTAADAQPGSERKAERWRRIVREAAEQSRRGRVPQLHAPQSFEALCKAAHQSPRLLLWEGEGAAPLRATLRQAPFVNLHVPLTVVSGPEGGISPDELEQSRACGMIAVTLGPRTLRAETAPLVAAAAILYELGDLN